MLLARESADLCPPPPPTPPPPPPTPPPPFPPPPPPPPPPPINILPLDPNALVGPAGYGTQGFIQPTGTLPYTIDFENDGSAAAQDVTVTEQLSSNLDWSTFQLGSFGFGSVNVAIPAGLTQYQTTVSYQNSDGSSLNVQVSLEFNVQTGLLTGSFVSLDPLTGQAPTGVFDGFLYPESESAVDSDGYVQYTIQPNSGLTTGTTISQQASIVFDTNAALPTAVVTNTIDAGPPTSSVAALPATETTPSFTVSWSGSDDPGGSGIATYAIYGSDDGGPYQLFTTSTSPGAATFTGQAGHSYSFYSVATDNVGNVQATPSGPQATTLVVTQQATALSAVSGSGNYADSLTLNATLTTNGTPVPNEPVSFALTVGGVSATFGPATTGANGVATLTVSLPAGIDAGTFTGAVTGSFAGDQNDESAVGTGDLTIAKAQATLGFSNLAATYDGQAQPATVTTNPAGLSGVAVAYTLYGAAVASPTTAGSYAVDASLNNPDYQATDAIGTLVISPSTPLVTWANPANIVYGTALGSAQLDATASVPGTFVYTPAAGTVLHAGQAQALSALFTPTDMTDYLSVTAQAVLNVTPAPLTITPVNQSKVYGAALPALADSYSGFVNGDTAASLTTQPTLSTTATAASHVAGSPYAITASSAVDPDYKISYVGGSLTITPAPLTITAVNQTKVYGAALPTLTASYSGFVNGDTPASLTTPPTLTTTAAASSHVSGNPYAITISGAVDIDYSISYVAGSLAITAAPLTVTAVNQSKVYGGPAARLDGLV